MDKKVEQSIKEAMSFLTVTLKKNGNADMNIRGDMTDIQTALTTILSQEDINLFTAFLASVISTVTVCAQQGKGKEAKDRLNLVKKAVEFEEEKLSQIYN